MHAVLERQIVLLFVLLQAVDMLTTQQFLSYGGIEMNPIVVIVITEAGIVGFALFKLLGTTAFLVYLRKRFGLSDRIAMLRFGCVIFVLIGAHNTLYLYHLMGYPVHKLFM